MAHSVSETHINLINLITEEEVIIRPLEKDSREGGFTREDDFMLSARNHRGEGVDVRFSTADAYALQDWLNEHLSK